MDVFFANADLEGLCCNERKAKKALGSPGFRKLRARLADFAAASCVTELVAGRPHPLSRNREGQYAVDLDGGRRLVFEPTSDPVPRKADGGISWQHVTSIRVVFIGDYHG